MESPISFVDAVVVIFTFLSAILAMARGITREVLGVASLIGASFFGALLADDLSPIVANFMDLQPIASKFNADIDVISAWITGTLVFIVMWIIFTVLTAKLSRFVNDSPVSGVDSTLGFVYGTLRGLFILGLIYTMYTHFISPEKYHSSVKEAKLKTVLDTSSSVIVDLADIFLPERIAEGFSKKPEAFYDATDSTDSLRNGMNPQTPEEVLEELQ